MIAEARDTVFLLEYLHLYQAGYKAVSGAREDLVSGMH